MKLLSAPVVILTSFLLQNPAWASNCKGLSEELRAMKKAQQSMLQSLADNHLKMADSLMEVTVDLELSNGDLPSPVMKSLRGDAKAYQKRGESARIQAQKLDQATAALIQRVEGCLKN